MQTDSPLNSKSQTVRLTTDDKKTLLSAVRIVEYHADEIVSIKMSRRSAQAINGDFIPPRPPAIPNPFSNPVIVADYEIIVDDSLDNKKVEINYNRSHASSDAEIKRKIKNYTLSKR